MKTVIMAGGKRTRISTLSPENPKTPIPVGGKTGLGHEPGTLRGEGVVGGLITG